MNKKFLSLFLLIRFLSSVGDQFLLFLVPILVYKITHNISMSGLAFFIEWMPRLVSLPLAGALSDKLGGLTVYLMSDGSRALLCGVGFLLMLGYPEHAFLWITLLMGGCAFFYAQSFIALESTLPILFGMHNVAKAQSLIQAIEQSALILGPLLASCLLVWVPIQSLLLVPALVFLLGFVGTLLLRLLNGAKPRFLQAKLAKSHVLTDMKIGLRVLMHDPRLMLLSFLTMMVNCIWGLALATSAALVTGFFSLPAHTFGVLQTVCGVLVIALSFSISILLARVSVFFIGVISYLLMVLGGFLVSASIEWHYFALFAGGYLLIMMLDSGFNVYIRAERVKLIPAQHLGKTIGVIVLINQLSLPLAGLLVRYFGHFGMHSLFLFCSLTALFAFCLLFKKMRPVAAKASIVFN